jgi:hypothetical protein
VPTNSQLRRALDRRLGQPLTADLAIEIERECDDFTLDQAAKPDALVIERLSFYLGGCDDAVRMMLGIIDLAHVWDDLVDRDQPVAPKAVNGALWFAVVGLQRNRFYAEHRDRLLPVIETGILNWFAANDLEADGRMTSLEVAHVIRCQVGDVLLLAAEIIHGHEFAAAHAAGIRMFVQQDARAEYLNDVKERAHA